MNVPANEILIKYLTNKIKNFKCLIKLKYSLLEAITDKGIRAITKNLKTLNKLTNLNLLFINCAEISYKESYGRRLEKT
jgi:hypothetical protein